MMAGASIFEKIYTSQVSLRIVVVQQQQIPGCEMDVCMRRVASGALRTRRHSRFGDDLARQHWRGV
jgi:hypothetical protein